MRSWSRGRARAMHEFVKNSDICAWDPAEDDEGTEDSYVMHDDQAEGALLPPLVDRENVRVGPRRTAIFCIVHRKV